MLTGESGLTAPPITRALRLSTAVISAHACSSTRDTLAWIPITSPCLEPAHSQTLVSEIVSSSWVAFVAKGRPEFARTVDIRYTFPRNFVDAGRHVVTCAHRWNSRTTYIHAKIADRTILETTRVYRPPCAEWLYNLEFRFSSLPVSVTPLMFRPSILILKDVDLEHLLYLSKLSCNQIMDNNTQSWCMKLCITHILLHIY